MVPEPCLSNTSICADSSSENLSTGILGWSAVVRSGAQLLGPLKDDVRVFHDGNLPSATWLAETGAVLPADVSFTASTLSAKRVCAQIIVSKQLLTQSVGSVSLDQYLADKIRVAVESVLDQAALYGTGGSRLLV